MVLEAIQTAYHAINLQDKVINDNYYYMLHFYICLVKVESYTNLNDNGEFVQYYIVLIGFISKPIIWDRKLYYLKSDDVYQTNEMGWGRIP